MEFADRVAFVTGAASGMGHQIARELCAQGARVALVDQAALGSDLDPERTLALRGDLCDESFVDQAVARAFATWGRLDYLVNAAGVLWFERDGSILDMDLEVWDRVLAINLKSVVHTVRHATPRMIETGGGAMVHFSSTQALRGDDKPQDAYQASKAAIIALSKTFAIQLAAHEIRSNVIVPGPTHTPMQARWDADPSKREAVARALPLGRVGTPRDMANACLFLLSDRASFITGTELLVDGGLLARP